MLVQLHGGSFPGCSSIVPYPFAVSFRNQHLMASACTRKGKENEVAQGAEQPVGSTLHGMIILPFAWGGVVRLIPELTVLSVLPPGSSDG